MKTWQQFLEGKKKMCGDDMDIEDKEEDLGKDLDNDNEEGESEDHKKKIFGKLFDKKKKDDVAKSKK